MQPDDQPVEPAINKAEAAADARFTDWMRQNLDRAARHFGLAVSGEPTLGWRLRTISAPATGPAGPRWLRVVTEFPEWAQGDSWTGNLDANALTGIPKPRVLDVFEWQESDWRHQRAELMTLLPGRSVSPSDEVQQMIALPREWWAQLRQSIDALSATPTKRVHSDQARVIERTRGTLGVEVHVDRWETVHGDLHWSNLLAPRLGILDWELWGRGPAGTDAATLLLYSVRVPEVFAQVHAVFADVLDSHEGKAAQLVVAARLYGRIADGDYPELAEPLDRHLRSLGVSYRL